VSITQDSSTPSFSTTQGGTNLGSKKTSGTVTQTSASFSPPAGSMVAVLAVATYSDAQTYTATGLTCSDSHSNSYSASVSQPCGSGGSFASVAIFVHYYSTAPGSTTVTVTLSSSEVPSTGCCVDIYPIVLDGTASSQTGAATASSDTTVANQEITIVTTTAGSWVLIANGFGSNNSSNTATAISGTTTLETVAADSNDNTPSWGKQTSATVTPGSTTLGWTTNAGASPSGAICALEILPATTTISGSATLSGSGSLTAGGAFAGGATLAGVGSLSAAGALEGNATFVGIGSLTGTASVGIGATLVGIGSLAAAASVAFFESATFTGVGTLSALANATYAGAVTLQGVGTISNSGVVFGYSATLTGLGTLATIGTGGTVFASPGVATPQAYAGSSQVAVAPVGSSNWQYLGTVGNVTALTYSYVCPGGCDKMTCTVMVPATYRTNLFNPGWRVRITRGGHTVWTGTLDEPESTTSGWNLTAVGDGDLGQNFEAYYTDSPWPTGQPDEVINRAIARGLPWVNPGIGQPSSMWFGQAPDPASQNVSDFLNLLCTRGSLTWYVNSQPGGYLGSDLSVFSLPTVVNRLLVCTQPVPRTLGGYVNYLFIRYEASSANPTTSVAASYAYTTVENQQSINVHGELEDYLDLSNVGVMSASSAQAVGNSILNIYQAASFAGPFTAQFGQLLNTGGAPIDPGTDQAGTVVKLILTDYGYGGEVTPQYPVTFIVGAYSWDDFAQTATITPYQNLDQSMSSLLSMEQTVLTPITDQS
jgi:hypothetical protein